ncbi:MAG: UDP-N-acetylglucosamine--N-acetylmuramyl-(pentapeptide) pyrophosphoryl-undecaprenol N-acetylglucosamine transferase, partial [Clostridia bacterium]|nr:UDP-N-acetylglucosamine--N-acetylmuramyl-(pentapeptide) pyrophosphoryl-undecaprenol N-acetylglucosamine transferase [Clostridia bacterium]
KYTMAMKKIMFCGGGSAGHVMPNIALLEQLADSYAISYIGTNAIEKSICNDFNVKFYEFDGVKLVRGKILCNLSIPFKLVKSVKQCGRILKNVSPDLLFCKGGYASLPPALAAAKLGIPVLTHESDITAGIANKIIASKSLKVMTSFPETAGKFKNGVYTGSPMREKLFNRDGQKARTELGLDSRPTVLVFGGGSGSKIINDNLRKIILKVCKRFNVLHVCGKGNAIDSNIYGYRQIEFTDDMGAVYACADYAVARCGSNSAHELIALKIPTLFIPLDNGASRGDQIKNAEYFKSAGLCRVLGERDLTPETLYENIVSLADDGQLKTALQTCNVKCGNDNIIKEIRDAVSR